MTNQIIDPIQEEIIAEFELFDQWLDKYNYLIELSDQMPLIDPLHRTDSYIIKGCQSRVWIDATQNNDKTLSITADSDAIITKGIITLLIKVLNHRTPEQILNTDLYFIDKIGLSANLSPTRANGLVAMIKQIRLFATAFQAKNNAQ